MRKKLDGGPGAVAIFPCHDAVETADAKSPNQNEGHLPGNGIPSTEADAMLHKPDYVTLHWFWNETRNRLESFRQRVRQGKDLDAAAEFARYVQWSGMLKLLEPHDRQGALKVDSAFLAWSAADLLREVQELWQDGKIVPGANQTQLQAIQDKLDIIAAHVGKSLTVRKSGRGRQAATRLRIVAKGP